MNILKNTKELGSKIEEKLEHGLEATKEVWDNVASHLPFANIAKHGNDIFSVEIDLPGVKKEDITLKIENNYLSINAVRKMKKEVKEKDYYLCESNFGQISRVFLLPEGINQDKIDAKLRDGRLYITLEKEESKKTKSIAIK